MTIPYAYRVSTCRGVGNFYKTLFTWHGSVYKMLWRDFTLYVITYIIMSVFYRYYLLVHQPFWGQKFGELILHFRANNSRIPIVFVLSFFVGIINERWWSQMLLLPWPDPICLQLSVLLRGQDRRGRMLRRTIARYLNLSIIFSFQLLSKDVRDRFPNLDSCCDAGLLLPHELAILKGLKEKINYPMFYVPVIWATNLVYRARRENRICHDVARRNLIMRIETFRGKLKELITYEVVCIPLAYTQVATIVVYVYFIVALFGNQFVHEDVAPKEIDVYIPIYGLLEFVFFVGWFKMAEMLLNPYGGDDHDFELNWMIDRNIQVAYLMVDEVHRAIPTCLRKGYYETVLKKPFYVAKRRGDGTYSNEKRPKGYEPPRPPPKAPEPEVEGPSEAEEAELFESFTVDEEKNFEEMFEELLTKSPPPSPAHSRRTIAVDLPTGSSEEPETDAETRSARRGRRGSGVATETVSHVGSALTRMASRRFSQMPEDERSMLRLRRQPSNFGRRMSLETAAPGTYRLDRLERLQTRQIIQQLSEPNELIPLVRTSVGPEAEASEPQPKAHEDQEEMQTPKPKPKPAKKDNEQAEEDK